MAFFGTFYMAVPPWSLTSTVLIAADQAAVCFLIQ
jgi:hypothetical protein